MPHLAGQLVLTCQGRLAQEDLTAELESATYVCFRLQRLFPIGSLASGQAVGPIQPGGQGGAGSQEGAGPGGQQTCHWG